jgi:hypothetical protein
MAIEVNIQLGTVGTSITRVKLQSCNSDCVSCTDLSGYEDVLVSTFQPSGRVITTIPDGTVSIKVIALDAACPSTSQCIALPGTGLFNDFTSDPEVNASEACSGFFFNPDPTVGNASTFCGSTTLTNPSYGQFATGTYYISYGVQYVQVSITNGNNTATVISSCVSCPTTTTSTTTTTTTQPSNSFCLGYGIEDCCAAKNDYDTNCAGPPP